MCLSNIKLLIFINLCIFFTSVVAGSPSCPHGWYKHGSSCYVFIDGVLNSWTEAMSFCKGLSAKLVEIETRDENDFLQHHLQNMMHGHNYWIGLTDAIVENEWLWMSTQQEAHFTNWGLLQPDNAQNNEDCADMAFFYPQGVWNDENCDAKLHFICEKELTSTTLLPVGNLVGAEQTRTSKTSEVGSGAIEELASSADLSHPPCVPCHDRGITGQSVDNSVCK